MIYIRYIQSGVNREANVHPDDIVTFMNNLRSLTGITILSISPPSVADYNQKFEAKWARVQKAASLGGF